ncbi:MAG TPA: hypothetical protein VGK81_10860, partial [Anaerolineae bacterium]
IISRPDGSEMRSVVTETQSVMLPSLLPLRWSSDGKSLLYSSEPTGIGGYILFDGFSSLYRLDIASGVTMTLIPKDNKRLICLDDINQAATSITEHCDELSIHVLSLTNNVSSTITPPAVVTDAAVLGSAIFSPDGSRVAFAMARNNPDNEQGWLALSNGLSGSSNLIYTSQPGTFASVAGWLDANTIVFQTSALTGVSNTPDTVWAINADGSNVRQLAQGDILTLEQAKDAPTAKPTQSGSLTLRQEAGSCQVAQFDQQSIQYGLCDGALASANYTEAWGSRAFNHFVQTFKSFSAKTVAGTIVFTGSGTLTASPAEQRMVAEFARLAVSRATGGSAVSEAALSWHREGGIVGFCDDVVVSIYGEVSATSCRGKTSTALGSAWLTGAQAEQLYQWVDSLKAFQITHDKPVQPDELVITAVFTGSGVTDAVNTDKQAVSDFAQLQRSLIVKP